jgi:hypothetical protein
MQAKRSGMDSNNDTMPHAAFLFRFAVYGELQ